MMIKGFCILVAVGLVTSVSFAQPVVAPPPPHGAPAQPSQGGASYLGLASCARSGCHGYSGPNNSAKVNQDEWYIWNNKDKHAKAYRALELPLSKTIARNLKLEKDATETARCLVCHSPLKASPASGAAAPSGVLEADQQSGVSCEVCHGAGSGWSNHFGQGASHETNVKNGMIDLKTPGVRAQMCLGCHLGEEDKHKSVDHELIAAGHPDLFFDLARFYTNMPPHSRNWSTASLTKLEAWAHGQAKHVELHFKRVAERANDGQQIDGKKKNWPEYAEQRCDACHHALVPADESWRQEFGYEGRQAGNIPFNLSRFAGYEQLLKIVGDDKSMMDAAGKVFAEMSQLNPNKGEVVKAAEAAQKIAAEVAGKVNSTTYDVTLAKKLFVAVTHDAKKIANHGQRAAMQATFLLHLLVETLKQNDPKALRSENDAHAALRELDENLNTPVVDDPTRFGNPSGFDGVRFEKSVAKLAGAVEAK